MAAKKDTYPPLSADDEAQIQTVLARREAMAEELHTSTSQAQAEALLAPALGMSEATQMALLKSLARAHDSAAADVLLAMHELAPEKAVRKEAKRALIQLAGAKIYPSWTSEQVPVAGALGVENTPRFWKGSVAEVRESGEVHMTLCWEQGFDYNEARMMAFLLDFWQAGVKDFVTEVGTKRHIEGRLSELQQATRAAEAEEDGDERSVAFADCTLAEGQRLLNEALDVNRWRKTEPHKDFRHHLALVHQLLLHTKETSEDRGQTFLAHDLEPDMAAVNFAGGWSMGDYGLCYDLLSQTSALHAGHSRDEWIALRRKWADEAHPARFEIYFLQERKQAQSALWLPTSALSARANAPKQVELGWSLELTETQLSGTLPEMPMGTAVYKETGRHWFWTVFTLVEEQGAWRISQITDEGAAIQSLPQHELQRRLKEHDDAIKVLMQEQQPTEDNYQQLYEELTWRAWQTLALNDALLVGSPLDKKIYEDAYGRALSIQAAERALVYADAQVTRLANDPDHVAAQQRLGVAQMALAERFEALNLPERTEHFRDLSEATLRATLADDQPLSYLLLAELLLRRTRYDEAEQHLLKARELAQEREMQTQIEFDLAGLALERERFSDAQGYLERLAEIDPNYPDLWVTLGMVQNSQHNYPEAEAYYRRALEENPAELRAYAYLNALYMEQHEFDKARDLLSQGIRALPQSAHLRALMSAVYLEKHDQRRALEYFREAERLNPNLDIVQALRSMIEKK